LRGQFFRVAARLHASRANSVWRGGRIGNGPVEQVDSLETVAAVIGHVAAVKIRVAPEMQSGTLSALGCC
jgi:hypothetical protein